MKEKSLAKDERVILIGNKPFMNYVTGVMYQFTQQNAEELTIKARGKHTGRAIDVAEVATKKFLNDTVQVGVDTIRIDSEEFNNGEKVVRVSTIEIVLKKNGIAGTSS